MRVLKSLFVACLFVSIAGWGAQAAPLVQEGEAFALITSPENNAVVGGQIAIVGSADHPSFVRYTVEVAPEPITDGGWLFLGESTEPVLNGTLATWDTETVPDGSYTIRLRVVRADGNYDEGFARQIVVTNSQPTPTPTPEVTETPTPSTPTATRPPPTPTPTVLIDQPVVDTPTPRPTPIPTSPPLDDPDDAGDTFIPEVTGFSFSPLRDACLYGAGLMLGLFLLFGFLAALRTFILGFAQRLKRN